MYTAGARGVVVIRYYALLVVLFLTFFSRLLGATCIHL